MGLLTVLVALFAASSSFLGVSAQDPGTVFPPSTPNPFRDPETGILFSQYSADTEGLSAPKGGFKLGLTFPENLDKNEYLGHIVGSRPNGKGWSAISHSSGMLNSLLLLAWVDGRSIQTSFRYATNYTQPHIYVGPLSFSQLAHTVNDTHFTLTYRCQGCFSWTYQGIPGNQSLTQDTVLFGWAQGTKTPSTPADPNSPIDFHDNGFGVFAAIPGMAANPTYDAWASRNQPPKTAAPKTATPALTLAGNQTAWPAFPKMTGAPAPMITTPKATAPKASVPAGLPAMPSSAAPPKLSSAPKGPVPAVAPSPQLVSPLMITVTRPQPRPSGENKSNGLPKAVPSGSNDDDGWIDVKTAGVRLFNTDAFLAKRQVQTSTSFPTPVPTPSDDLGAFPNMSGVPHKPPAQGPDMAGLLPMSPSKRPSAVRGSGSSYMPPKKKRGTYIVPRKQRD